MSMPRLDKNLDFNIKNAMHIQIELSSLLLLKIVAPLYRSGQEVHKALHALHKVRIKWE